MKKNITKKILTLLLTLFVGFSTYSQNKGKETQYFTLGQDMKAKENQKTIVLSCNGKTLEATLEDNESSKSFIELLKQKPVTSVMHDYGDFEKSGSLGATIKRSDTNFTANYGDIILYQGNTIVIYYDTNTYNFTKLGHIDNATQKEIKDFVKAGGENVSVTFSLKTASRQKQNNKTLVAYFSATGNTKKIARAIAEVTEATLFEIVPQMPYSKSDLDYNNSNCRANKECQDTNFRCPIKNKIPDIKDYDTIFLGFPIWWGKAPSIIQTFLESADFSGKKIALFCTSGSSGLGNTQSILQKSASGAKWLGEKRFGAGDTSGAKKWATGISE